MSNNNDNDYNDNNDNLAKQHLSFDSEHRLRTENLPYDIVRKIDSIHE